MSFDLVERLVHQSARDTQNARDTHSSAMYIGTRLMCVQSL